MITVKEIARMCGVSAGTVSNVLNGRPNVGRETRERVLEAIKETGYQPNYFASSIRKQNTRMISIIAEDLCQFSTPPIVSAAMAYCEERGYRTVLMNLRMYDRWEDARFDREKLDATLHPVLKEVQSIKVDGVIYVAGHCRTIGSFPGEFGLPSIIAYATSEGGRFPSVIPDDEKGGRDMIRYLLSMGHEKSALWPERRGTFIRRAVFAAAAGPLRRRGFPGARNGLPGATGRGSRVMIAAQS